jgi:hypothetical protein
MARSELDSMYLESLECCRILNPCAILYFMIQRYGNPDLADNGS